MWRRTSLFVLLVLGGCGGPELPPLPPRAKVLAFGDSLTYGTGAAGQGYPEVLAELTDLAVVNAGVPGEVSARGRERLPALLEEHRPALVVLVHGGNDTLRNISPARTRENLIAMIEVSRSAGAEVVMLGVPGRNLTLSAPGYYRDVAVAADVPIDLDVLPRLMRDRAVKSDSVHFNGRGYRLMAEAVRDLLEDSGAL
ncbi:MAG: GDSL-type esterase/lipase family protein [Pseudomonadales bacterium]|nr:GDSL-type esterase/lipase family protein [Pseudomonadales bacterium]